MRSMILPSLALTCMLSLPALAEDSGKPQAPAAKGASAQQASKPKKDDSPHVQCSVQAKNGSRAVQGQDLILNAGEKTKNAVAVDGNVVVRKGAEVKDVVAFHGKITVEEGAVVTGDAVALGGGMHLAKKARVDGDAVALGGSLDLDEGASVGGDRVGLSLSFNGTDIARSFLEKALKGSQCHITVDDNDHDADDHDDGDHDDDDHDDDDHDGDSE